MSWDKGASAPFFFTKLMVNEMSDSITLNSEDGWVVVSSSSDVWVQNTSTHTIEYVFQDMDPEEDQATFVLEPGYGVRRDFEVGALRMRLNTVHPRSVTIPFDEV